MLTCCRLAKGAVFPPTGLPGQGLRENGLLAVESSVGIWLNGPVLFFRRNGPTGDLASRKSYHGSRWKQCPALFPPRTKSDSPS